MQIAHAAVHRVFKSAESREVRLELVDHELEVNDECKAFVSDLLQTYNGRTAQRTATFEVDTTNYPFSELLDRFTTSKLGFIEFTHAACRHFEHRISKQVFATGGYLLFVDYSHGSTRYLMVLQVNETVGSVFDRTLTRVEKTPYLNVDHLKAAGRVNINEWRSQAGKYLTFVAGRDRGHAADYFVEFLGCSTTTQPPVESRKLVNVVKSYCASENMPIERATAFKQAVYDHVMSRKRDNLPVSLRGLANVVVPDAPETFLAFVNNSPDPPSDEFFVYPQSVKRLLGYRFNGEGLNFAMTEEFKEFHRVHINRQGNLIIHSPPQGLVDEINQAS
jgi:nucleoid-associated protein